MKVVESIIRPSMLHNSITFLFLVVSSNFLFDNTNFSCYLPFRKIFLNPSNIECWAACKASTKIRSNKILLCSIKRIFLPNNGCIWSNWRSNASNPKDRSNSRVALGGQHESQQWWDSDNWKTRPESHLE